MLAPHHSESTVKTFGRLEANYPPLRETTDGRDRVLTAGRSRRIRGSAYGTMAIVAVSESVKGGGSFGFFPRLGFSPSGGGG